MPLAERPYNRGPINTLSRGSMSRASRPGELAAGRGDVDAPFRADGAWDAVLL